MGKEKRSKRASGAEGKAPRGPHLADQIMEDKTVRAPGRVKDRNRTDADDEFVNDKLTRNILDQARKQQEDLEEEHGSGSGARPKAPKKVHILGAEAGRPGSDSEDEDLADHGQDTYEEIVIEEDDEKALQMFMAPNPPVRRTLGDIIMEKITEKQTEIQSQMTDANSMQVQQIDERVVAMYKSVGGILSKYRSGKLPKAFKIIPSLTNWEQVLYLTEPDKWTAAAMYQATRIFASNMNAKMAQRFYNLVLLPRVRDDIIEYKRLNYHLFQALSKSLFKPSAFFKGILLPLCECGNCTLREAIIISSVLTKNSIPMLHSAAAILKIAEMDYNGANSIFLKTLLDKKYALAYRVVDAMVFHFLRFIQDKREMPVLWHQCLLVFVQRYKEDISSEQKQSLLDLLKAHPHFKLTQEIRREVTHSKCRDMEDWEGPSGMVVE